MPVQSLPPSFPQTSDGRTVRSSVGRRLLARFVHRGICNCGAPLKYKVVVLAFVTPVRPPARARPSVSYVGTGRGQDTAVPSATGKLHKSHFNLDRLSSTFGVSSDSLNKTVYVISKYGWVTPCSSFRCALRSCCARRSRRAAVAHPYVSQYGALLNTVISRMVLRKRKFIRLHFVVSVRYLPWGSSPFSNKSWVSFIS